MLFEAKCVKLLRSKVFLLSKVFFEAKCASAVYVERQRREHAIKLQSFPEYDVPLWSFTNVYEMTMFILLFDYIFKVKGVSLKFCHDMFANFLNGIPLLDHLPLSTILIKRQENRRSSTLKACAVQAPS